MGMAGCPGAAGSYAFFDDFECGTGLWTPFRSNTFALASDGSNVYATTSIALSYASAGNPAWTNVRIEARVKLIPPQYGGGESAYAAIYGRYVDPYNYYAVLWRGDGAIELRVLLGTWNSITTYFGSVYTVGEWHTLRMDIVGMDMTGYVDDVLVGASSGNTLTSGQVAVGSNGLTGEFDDVRVTLL
jgi:hypothetical protein